MFAFKCVTCLPPFEHLSIIWLFRWKMISAKDTRYVSVSVIRNNIFRHASYLQLRFFALHHFTLLPLNFINLLLFLFFFFFRLLSKVKKKVERRNRKKLANFCYITVRYFYYWARGLFWWKVHKSYVRVNGV